MPRKHFCCSLIKQWELGGLRCSTRVGSLLTTNIRLGYKSFFKMKRFSLLCQGVYYRSKIFIKLATGQSHSKSKLVFNASTAFSVKIALHARFRIAFFDSIITLYPLKMTKTPIWHTRAFSVPRGS